MASESPPRLAILGAGPIGLEAALAAAERGWPFTVYEASDEVGGHVRAWGHVRLFTPWAMNISARMHERLTRAGVALPDPDACPTGAQLHERLLAPLSRLALLAPHVQTATRVRHVGRRGLLKHEQIASPARAAAPFRLLLETGGVEREVTADLVFDCTGTYGSPNCLGDGGIPAVGETALDGRIERWIPVAGAPGRRVLLVGAGKSAQTAARELGGTPGTELTWVVRSPAPDWGAVPGDTLAAREDLVRTARELAGGRSANVRVLTGSVVEQLAPAGAGVRVRVRTPGVAGDEVVELEVDRVVSLTGYAADPALYRQLQVHECYATGAPMNLSAALLGAAGADCLTQPALGVELLRNPEPGFYLLGIKSYGRANTFLLRVGYEQVHEVFASYPGPDNSSATSHSALSARP